MRPPARLRTVHPVAPPHHDELQTHSTLRHGPAGSTLDWIFAELTRVHLFNTILTLTIGVIRDSRIRRTCMFYCVLVALIMLFSGSTFLTHALRENVWVFVGYWFVCAWLTITAVLLALYDMIAIRAAARRERRRMEKEVLRRAQESLVNDENKA